MYSRVWRFRERGGLVLNVCLRGVRLLAFMRITSVIEIVIEVIIFDRKFGLNLG